MVAAIGGSAKVIFDQIESLYTDQVGPIAAVLVQEALDQWVDNLRLQNKKPSLRNISGYLEILAREIGNDADRQAFINSVFEIQALVHYKQNYKGSL